MSGAAKRYGAFCQWQLPDDEVSAVCTRITIHMSSLLSFPLFAYVCITPEPRESHPAAQRFPRLRLTVKCWGKIGTVRYYGISGDPIQAMLSTLLESLDPQTVCHLAVKDLNRYIA